MLRRRIDITLEAVDWTNADLPRKSITESGPLWPDPASPRALTAARLANMLRGMSLAQLKDEATCLDLGEQRELIAFLIARQTEQDEEFQDTLARKIDDKDPARWVELDDLQKRYAD